MCVSVHTHMRLNCVAEEWAAPEKLDVCLAPGNFSSVHPSKRSFKSWDQDEKRQSCLRVKVTAVPEEGRDNKALIKYNTVIPLVEGSSH